MATLERSIYLNQVHYRLGNRKDGYKPPAFTSAIRKVFAKAPRADQRHYPANPQRFTQCCMLNRIIDDRPSGLLFEVCTYVYGMDPEQADYDLSQPSLQVRAEPIRDPATGRRKQAMVSFRCLAHGSAVIIENANGRGGNALLEKCLRAAFRQHVDPKAPRPTLINVASKSLPDKINRGGGVSEVIMDLAHPQPAARYPFAQRLAGLRGVIPNTQVLRATFMGKKNKLSESEAIAALQESQSSDGPERVVLVLADGSRIADLSELKMKTSISVPLDDDGTPNVFEVGLAMRDYLERAQRPINGSRILTPDGEFTGR